MVARTRFLRAIHFIQLFGDSVFSVPGQEISQRSRNQLTILATPHSENILFVTIGFQQIQFTFQATLNEPPCREHTIESRVLRAKPTGDSSEEEASCPSCNNFEYQKSS